MKLSLTPKLSLITVFVFACIGVCVAGCTAGGIASPSWGPVVELHHEGHDAGPDSSVNE